VLAVFDENAGQSGRRASRPQPSPNPAELPSQQPSTGETAAAHRSFEAKLPHKVHLLVARQRTSKRLPSEDVISASFLKRLGEHADVVGTSIGDLKRDEAVKRAQKESDSFVVVLQFEIDNFQDGALVLNSPDLEVKYFIFAPGTGKQRSKGKVYYHAIGGGRMRKSNWPTGTPIKITTEAAGIEAAEQLYYSLVTLLGVKQG